MTTNTHNTDPVLQQYLNSIGQHEHPVLTALRERTQSHRLGKMAIAQEQAAMLVWLAKLLNAKKYLEVGVFTGYSSTAMALALPEDEGGIPWIATNTDWTIPQARGIAPGNGTLVSAVHTAVGRLAVVAGKPERPIFDEAVARFGARHPLFIGDRLDTDIAGAQAAGIESVLVLTGIDRPKHVLAAPSTSRPTFIVGDLRELHEPYPETVVQGDVTSVGTAAVRIDGPDVHIVRAGDRPIDLVRAGAAAIWATGRAIYGFRVPEELYADPFHRP